MEVSFVFYVTYLPILRIHTQRQQIFHHMLLIVSYLELAYTITPLKPLKATVYFVYFTTF